MICIAQEYRSYIQGFRQIFYIKALHNHKNWIIFDLATIILRCLDHLEFRHQNHRFQCIKTETQDNVVFTASARWRTRIKTNGQRHQLQFLFRDTHYTAYFYNKSRFQIEPHVLIYHDCSYLCELSIALFIYTPRKSLYDQYSLKRKKRMT